MAIQNRRGDFKDFDPYKMVPGEFAIITSGDPNSKDGTSVYHCFAPGVVKRLTSYEDLKEQVDSAVVEIIDERIEEALKDLEISGGGATEEQIGQIETNKQNIENLQQTVDNIKIPAKTSELNNDSGFITSAVNDLANYYLKNQTYSRTEIDNKLSAIPKFSIEVVSSLPTSNISTTTVYLVSTGSETNNLYTEYIYVNNKWEYLGKQTVDLTGYVQKTELSSYYTKTEMESLLTTIRNSIPTKISQLAEDSTHRTVTDAEKQTWNNKANTATTLAGYGITDGTTKEQFDQLSQEIVDYQETVNGMSLGIASDGLIYLFRNGEPVGTGIPQGQIGDVFGYVDENNVVVLNGNLADGTYTMKYEMKNGDIVNIGSMVLDSNVYYSIASNLTNCTNSNSTKTVVEGSSYSATISASSGHNLTSITVTMGGVDITSTAVSGGNISIASVTGNVVITAVATAEVTKTNFADPTSADWATDSRLSSSGVPKQDSPGKIVTNFIGPVISGDIVTIEGLDISDSNAAGYTSSKAVTPVGSSNLKNHTSQNQASDITVSTTGGQFTIGSYASIQNGYYRFAGTPNNTVNDIKIYIKRNGEWL